ncbi:MAG: tRNA pseudouridine(38-40) synthase TruA [Flavobacteriaceae bacterium]|nr:tRNA pseudouridine(38-40) synthase TruA [Flavobacteriaceae bacterium]
MRFFLELSYNGTSFHGWQRQPNALSVQELVEEALTKLLKVNTTVMGAGRTDTGVHAAQMYAHFDVAEMAIDTDTLLFRMNRFLPNSIAIHAIHPVSDKAHARFDATSRSYEYHIVQRKNPFHADSAYCFMAPIALDAMNTAAALLLSHTNFKCFSRSRTDVKTYDCDVTIAQWESANDSLTFHITANRFLRNMVRAIVGTLLDVGTGKISLDEFQQILNSNDRTKAGSSAPAQGLFLTEVRYPNTIFDVHGN